MSKYPPDCPFCGRYVERPQDKRTEFGDINHGLCTCGAVYVCDRTGHNAGQAYLEALFLMRGGWDIENLDPDIDYDMVDMNYDVNAHRRVDAAGAGTKTGKLVFVKLKGRGPAPERERSGRQVLAASSLAKEEKGSQPDKGRLKDRVRSLLERKAFEEIAEIGRQDKAVVRWLISFSYDRNDVLTWRAAEALGKVSAVLAENRIGAVRDVIGRLLWTMREESGGTGWTSAEMLGEILRNNPEQFSDVIPVLWSFRDEETFRAGVVWAMGRIADARPDRVSFIREDLGALLMDDNPEVRGYAAMVIGKLGDGDSLRGLNTLLQDTTALKVYRNGELEGTTVAGMAEEATNKHIK